MFNVELYDVSEETFDLSFDQALEYWVVFKFLIISFLGLNSEPLPLLIAFHYSLY